MAENKTIFQKKPKITDQSDQPDNISPFLPSLTKDISCLIGIFSEDLKSPAWVEVWGEAMPSWQLQMGKI